MSCKIKKNCEYFLISGFNKNRNPYDLSAIYNQGEEICISCDEKATDFFHYKEPIVDIQLVHQSARQRLSNDYIVIDKTYSKSYKADLNAKTSMEELYICFRYGRDLSPITDIGLMKPKQKPSTDQSSWKVVTSTVSGQSANLHTAVSPLYLAYHRAAPDAPVDHLVVTDICVVLSNKHEESPPAYTLVGVPIKRSPISNSVQLCYKKSVVKHHVLTFQPHVLYCVSSVSMEPIVDVYSADIGQYKSPDNLPDDIGDVANFCMPWGATIESWPSSLQKPQPSFITFVLTNCIYERLYGAAMLFYEDFDKAQLTEEEIVNLCLQDSAVNDMRVFATKSICILSRCPLFQTFNRVLSFLIEEDQRQRCIDASHLNMDSEILPLERFISQFLYHVPFPSAETPNILLQWDLQHPISIQLPIDPVSKVGTTDSLYHLLRMLDVEQIIQLFTFMLTEQKILVTSTLNSDLTMIAEALLSIIFPLRWSVVYIPFLYLGCIHIIQSPSPYLIGVHSTFFDYFRLPEGVGCIDLINKSIKSPYTSKKYLHYQKVMPKNVLNVLQLGLQEAKVKVEEFETQQKRRKSEKTSMYDFKTLRSKEVIVESIKECFLKAVLLMFRNYQRFLLPISSKNLSNDDMFDNKGFLKSVDKKTEPLYEAIFDTQLWNHFVLERSYVTDSDNSLEFFDRCIKFMEVVGEEKWNLSYLLQSDGIVVSEHTKVMPPPEPLMGWSRHKGVKTFPVRLDSALMIPITVDAVPRQSVYKSPLASVSVNDSSIPWIHIRAISKYDDPTAMSISSGVSVLRRPSEEVKQARQLAKEARRGLAHVWAGHLLTSVYCLWHVTLPGLIGCIEDTPALSGTGLVARVLELAIDMIRSILKAQFLLPDQVCVRVLLLLVHQHRPPRVSARNITKCVNLNVFSYGLYNQILLEEESRLANSPGSDLQSGQQSKDEEPSMNDIHLDSVGLIEVDEPRVIEPEKDGSLDPRVMEVNDGETGKKSRTGTLLYNSIVDLSTIDTEHRYKFFDRSSGVVVSQDSEEVAHNSQATISPPPASLDSVQSALIVYGPRSEHKEQLHASLRRVTGSMKAADTIYLGQSDEDISVKEANGQVDSKTMEGSSQVIKGDSTQRTPHGSGNTNSQANTLAKSSASFRQLKRMATRSFRSIRRFVSTLGPGGIGQSESSVSSERPGMPSTYRVWENTSARTSTFEGDRPYTQSPLGRKDIGLDSSLGSEGVGRVTTVEEDGEDGDDTYDHSQRMNPEIPGPLALYPNNIWQKITSGLSAVKLPLGMYWLDDEAHNGQSPACVQCSLGVSVTMTTSSECTYCHFIVYDDDIMNGWSPDDNDLSTTCPYCSHRFSPALSFKVFIDQRQSHPTLGSSPAQQPQLAYQSQVIYLSPFLLRKELESVLAQEGEQALLTPSFLPRHSILYWNLILYYSRLLLPSHIFSFIISWLRDSGRRLTGMSDEAARCDILMDLTGHEEVIVTYALEMDNISKEIDPPLYRKQLEELTSPKNVGTASFRYTSSGAILEQIVKALFKSDMRLAMEIMLRVEGRQYRSPSKEDFKVMCRRSIYRELMHLAIFNLEKHDLDLATFHDMYKEEWSSIIRTRPHLASSQHKPPSDSAFYCRKLFQSPRL